MAFQAIQTILTYFLVCALAFEDLIYVYGQGNKEMLQQGRVQYQLLRERVNLPKYGSCWKSAVEHINDGCRYLSEDTQSDIALHITNCFLEMSGHPTYNCELDKKPNLRGICINSMTDRAFNVYTEFYTHTQNICWFLRGQIWHETIAENTLKVGRQLEYSAEQQRSLIDAQKESLQIQEKMMRHGKFLEEILEDLYVSMKGHQEVLKVLTKSVQNLQGWIVGEVSWIDSIMFYGFAIFLTFILTSSPRTISARLPLFFLLFVNLLIERFICSIMVSKSAEFDTQNLYSSIYNFVWYSRYAFTFLAGFILIYRVFVFKDIFHQNNELLGRIQLQNKEILEALSNINSANGSPIKSVGLDFVNETNRKTLEGKLNDLNENKSRTKYSFVPNIKFARSYSRNSSIDNSKENLLNGSFDDSTNKRLYPLNEVQNKRYYLRNSRQGTPDSSSIS